MFDRYAAATAPRWGRRALIMASVLVHATAAIVLVIWSLCRVEGIDPPALTITIWRAPPPPPPPAVGGAKASHPKPRTVVATLKALIEPKPMVEPSSVADEPTDAPEGPGTNGDPSGKPGGTGIPGGTGDTSNAPATPRFVPQFVLAAQQLQHDAPHVDEAFKAQHPHESVKGAYRVCIGTDGHVTDVTTLVSIPGQDASLASQIKRGWLYKPQAVPVCTKSSVVFNIN